MAFTASGVVASLVHNSIQQALTTGTSYQVCVALVGKDTVTDGYAVTPSTVSSGSVVLANTQNAIAVTLTNASWPTNYLYAGFVAIFLKAGGGNFQLAACAPMDQSNDMVVLISALPLSTVQSFSIAVLNSTTVDATNALGNNNRAPVGYAFTTLTPTTEDVVQTDGVPGKVTFLPNTSGDFSVATVRDFKIQFKTMANDVVSFIQAGAGESSQYTTGGHTYTQSQRAYNTTSIIVKGNMPLIITMPPDPATGIGETMLCTSLLLQNQQELQMAWSKSKQTPIPWLFESVPDDILNFNLPCVWTYARV